MHRAPPGASPGRLVSNGTADSQLCLQAAVELATGLEVRLLNAGKPELLAHLQFLELEDYSTDAGAVGQHMAMHVARAGSR